MNVRRRSESLPPTSPATQPPSGAPASVKNASVPPGSTFATGSAPKLSAPSFTNAAKQPLVRLDPGSVEAQAAVQATIDYLRQATPGMAKETDPASAFVLKSVDKDDLGMTHVRMDRMYQGVPVFGQQIISHLDPQGKVRDLTDYNPAIPSSCSTSTSLSAHDATAAAMKDFKLMPQESTQPQKVLFQTASGDYKAAYSLELTNIKDGPSPQRMRYVVDGNSGEILFKFNQLDTEFADLAKRSKGKGGGSGKGHTPAPAPTKVPSGTAAVGSGSSIYAGTVTLNTIKNNDGSGYTLEDTTRNGNVTYDAMNQEGDPSSSKVMVDNNNNWAEKSDNAREKAAVDAAYVTQNVIDFHKDFFGRNSIDNKGEELNTFVHEQKDYDNAYYDGGNGMHYGDGDGDMFGPLVSQDVGGHELEHGVTQNTSGLIYSGESGGLNEGFSDVLGKGSEWYVSQKNPAESFSWWIGAKIMGPTHKGEALRYMDDPTKDGYSIDNYKNYAKSDKEVHRTSGILNNAAYLTAMGGTNRTSGLKVDKGIGIEKMLRIFDRTNTVYLTPNGTFKAAAQGAIKAATDLYGANSQEVQTVTQAFKAVGCI